MSGGLNLVNLLRDMSPVLFEPEYVFCTGDFSGDVIAALDPIGQFREKEGCTLIVERSAAVREGLEFGSTFRMITLDVHSSLEAVGFLAAVTSHLAESGISTNAVAGYYHDHLFVPADRADDALSRLLALAADFDRKR